MAIQYTMGHKSTDVRVTPWPRSVSHRPYGPPCRHPLFGFLRCPGRGREGGRTPPWNEDRCPIQPPAVVVQKLLSVHHGLHPRPQPSPSQCLHPSTQRGIPFQVEPEASSYPLGRLNCDPPVALLRSIMEHMARITEDRGVGFAHGPGVCFP